MLYRKMKKTGDELSQLGYGCMRLPTKRGRVDEQRAIAQIRLAIDRGVNYVDTAMPYHFGASETVVGKALSDGYRDKVKLADKLTPLYVNKPDDLERILNAQLTKLKTDRIDYYLAHGLNAELWEKVKRLGVMAFMEQAQKDGRIVNIGFSFHGDKDTFKEIVDAYDWSFCQIQYNYLDETHQAGTEGLEYAAQKGLGVIVMEPLRGGHLAGRVPKSVKTLLDGAKTKRSPADWALRWIWNRPEVSLVLSGMNEEDHIEENLRVAGDAKPGGLTDDEVMLLSQVKDTFKALTRVDCTGCRYCMPCPHGVNIPSCFEVYNHKYLFDDPRGGKMLYMVRLGGVFDGGEPAFASLCQECGECEEVCTMNLPFQSLMNYIVEEFEGRGLRTTMRISKMIMGAMKWGTLLKLRLPGKR
jgi:predicted aldo/keto reductase-like oxidoreductase